MAKSQSRTNMSNKINNLTLDYNAKYIMNIHGVHTNISD